MEYYRGDSFFSFYLKGNFSYEQKRNKNKYKLYFFNL